MTRLTLSALLLLALSACSHDVETHDELVDRMVERYEDNRGGVAGFVVTAGGAEATHAALPDSAAALAPPVVVPVADAPSPEAASLLIQHVANVRLLADTLRTATMEGPIDRGGYRVYLLASEQPGRALYVVVDAETFDVREIEQSVRVDTLAQPLVTRLLYDDFRTVDGLTLPFRVRQVNEGLGQFISASERMVQGGRLGMKRQALEQERPSAERDRRRAALERQMRLYSEGVQETELRIDGVRVTPR